MSGVARDKLRIRQTAEVFTPTLLVREMLDKISEDQFLNPNKTFLDPTCGDGQFLSEVMIRKMENGSTYQQALDTIFGADLMEDNIVECIRRLYGPGDIVCIKRDEPNFPEEYNERGLIAVFTHNGKLCRNIVQADGLEYQYNFGRPPEVPDHMKGLFALKKKVGLV